MAVQHATVHRRSLCVAADCFCQHAAVRLPQDPIAHVPAATYQLDVRLALRRHLPSCPAAQRPANGAAAAARSRAVAAPAATACWVVARGPAANAPQILVQAQAADASWPPVAREQAVGPHQNLMMVARGMPNAVASDREFHVRMLGTELCRFCRCDPRSWGKASSSARAALRIPARPSWRSLLCDVRCPCALHVPPIASCDVPRQSIRNDSMREQALQWQGDRLLARPGASAGLKIVAPLMQASVSGSHSNAGYL